MQKEFILYRFWNEDKLLYVGISTRAYERLKEHQGNAGFYKNATAITLERFENLESLRKAERVAIAEEKPLHNAADGWTKNDNCVCTCSMHVSQVRARAKKQHEQHRKDGLFWGVDIGPKPEVPVNVVKRILVLQGLGFTLRGTARRLNELGVPTARGGQWQAVQVSRVLKSPRMSEMMKGVSYE